MAVSSIHNGWYFDRGNSRLDMYYRGTRVASINASDMRAVLPILPSASDGAALGSASVMWADLFLASGGVVNFNNGDVTLTHSTGILTLNDRLVISADDARVSAGNLRLGTVSTFATTEPTNAVVMKTGTAPSGAIATSGGLFTDGTTVKKIIADGTVSDVQT